MIKTFKDCPLCEGTGTQWFLDQNGELDDDTCCSCADKTNALFELCLDAELNTYNLQIMEAKLDLFASTC